jgi:2-polyprenyl-3-methyl-5-hydroxy-6-metoxy-1,4-benzoquinol methylase
MTITAQSASLIPDAIPNRYLVAGDWSDPRYSRLRAKFDAFYRDAMGGDPHPYGAKHPERIVTHWSREWEYPWAVLNARLAPGMTAVDLGCGGSPLLPYLARENEVRGTGVDLVFKSTTKRHNLRGFITDPATLYPEIEWKLESMTALSLADASQDRVFCISVLEHVKPDIAKETMREIVRVLKPGGLALFTTDVGGEHRTLTIDFRELIEIAQHAGLVLEGASEFTEPADVPGTYHVVGFMLAKPRA